MLLRSLQRRAAARTPSLLRASRLLFQHQQLFSSDDSAVANAPSSVVSPPLTGDATATAASAEKPKKQKAVQQPPATTWHSLVIGEIVSFEAHPTADRLNVCQVDVGDKENLLQIVCGAPNVRQGARVPVATVGSKLALKDAESGDIKLVKIKKSKLRGEVSQGMICSEAELGLADSSDGILILEADAPVGGLVQDWGSVARRLVKPSSKEEQEPEVQ
ncbi:Actin-related protein 2/3 complex subunit [Globisporangium polare]